VTYRSGAADKAAALAGDAIQLARTRTNRIAECQALLVRATALLDSRSSRTAAQAEPLLARAEQLVEISGTSIFRPMLDRAQSFLARSYRLRG
jgi:hypothetical protein